MKPSIVRVSRESFKDIPYPCRCCLYWQTTGDHGEGMLDLAGEAEKRRWFDTVTREFGDCMKIAYVNGRAVGFVLYAPARFLPRTKEYVSGQPSEDAVFIACLYVEGEKCRGKGLGSAMLKDLEDELKRRGFRVIETFARRSSANNPSGPLGFYVKHGFRATKDEHDFPLVRLEL